MTKAEERKARQAQAKNRGRQKQVKLLLALLVIAVVIAAVSYGVWAKKQAAEAAKHIQATVNANGDVVIQKNQVTEGLQYLNYGGPAEIMVVKASDGTIRTAFNYCEECLAETAYKEEAAGLYCTHCGNGIYKDGMGISEWGGHQPVAISEEYRTETEEEIVVTKEFLDYCEEMFDMWSAGDFSRVLDTSYVTDKVEEEDMTSLSEAELDKIIGQLINGKNGQ